MKYYNYNFSMKLLNLELPIFIKGNNFKSFNFINIIINIIDKEFKRYKKYQVINKLFIVAIIIILLMTININMHNYSLLG